MNSCSLMLLCVSTLTFHVEASKGIIYFPWILISFMMILLFCIPPRALKLKNEGHLSVCKQIFEIYCFLVEIKKYVEP